MASTAVAGTRIVLNVSAAVCFAVAIPMGNATEASNGATYLHGFCCRVFRGRVGGHQQQDDLHHQEGEGRSRRHEGHIGGHKGDLGQDARGTIACCCYFCVTSVTLGLSVGAAASSAVAIPMGNATEASRGAATTYHGASTTAVVFAAGAASPDAILGVSATTGSSIATPVGDATATSLALPRLLPCLSLLPLSSIVLHPHMEAMLFKDPYRCRSLSSTWGYQGLQPWPPPQLEDELSWKEGEFMSRRYCVNSTRGYCCSQAAARKLPWPVQSRIRLGFLNYQVMGRI